MVCSLGWNNLAFAIPQVILMHTIGPIIFYLKEALTKMIRATSYRLFCPEQFQRYRFI